MTLTDEGRPNVPERPPDDSEDGEGSHPGDLLPWFVAGTLAAAEAEEVRSHLGRCSDCRREVALLERMREGVRDGVELEPVDEVGLRRLRRRIEEEEGRSGPSWFARWPAGARWAAAVALLLAAGNFGLVVRQTALRADLEAERQRSRALVARLEGDITEGSPGEPAPLLAGGPLVNQPFEVLVPTETVRGTPESVLLPPGAKLLFLVLPVPEGEAGDHFRLTVRHEETGRAVCCEESLERDRLGELRVVLPRDLLEPGIWRFELSRPDGEPIVELRRRMELQSGGQRSPLDSEP